MSNWMLIYVGFEHCEYATRQFQSPTSPTIIIQCAMFGELNMYVMFDEQTSVSNFKHQIEGPTAVGLPSIHIDDGSTNNLVTFNFVADGL